MRRTLQLAEAAAYNTIPLISEAVDPEAFGNIRALVQKAAGNGRSLRQIATALASMDASQAELEETMVPYIKGALKGVFAAFLPLGDVMDAYEQDVAPNKAAPKDKKARVLWWMLKLQQGVKEFNTGSKPQPARFSYEELFGYMVKNLTLDVGGADAIVEVDVYSDDVSRYKKSTNKLIRAISGANSLRLDFRIYNATNYGEQQSARMAREFVSVAKSYNGSVDVVVVFDIYDSGLSGDMLRQNIMDIAYQITKPSNVRSLIIAGGASSVRYQSFTSGMANHGEFEGVGFSKYTLKKHNGDPAIEFT